MALQPPLPEREQRAGLLVGCRLPPAQSSVASQIFQQGAVVTDAARCSSLGIKVLSQQGSSVDAAVAAALCLGIVAPHSSGLGG